MSSKRESPVGLLVATVLLGALAIGGGLWVRYRPTQVLQLSDDRGDIDGAMLRLKDGPFASRAVVLRASDFWLSKHTPSPGPGGGPTGHLIRLDDDSASVIDLEGPGGSMRVAGRFDGFEVGHGIPNSILSGQWGEAVSLSPGGMTRDAVVSPGKLQLGAFGVHLGRALWMANESGGVRVMERAVDLWVLNEMQETAYSASWPQDLFPALPATSPP